MPDKYYISPEDRAITNRLNEGASYLEVAMKFNKTEKEIKDIQTLCKKKAFSALDNMETTFNDLDAGREPTFSHKSNKIVGYCYSQSDWIGNTNAPSNKGITLEEQRDALKEHARLWGYELTEIFEDISLKGEITTRPALTRLTNRLREKYSDIEQVVVCELDLLGGSVYGLDKLEKRFRELNAPLYSIKEPSPITEIVARKNKEDAKTREAKRAYGILINCFCGVCKRMISCWHKEGEAHQKLICGRCNS
ncbi:hypothetical protein LCGC14_1562970 [marine sediment metagenome]|uniref:Resolvase/invertase-type recombinase catalytic domain-containing protein n=1 Tax=marine sediment metagenome TaxID=412755 RepID=A0A0F9L3D0_9ZZZZ